MPLPGAAGYGISPDPIQGLMRRIEDLERQFREALPSVAKTLAEPMLQIQEQQTEMALRVAEIETLVGEQVTGESGNASTGGTAVSVSTSLADYATITFTVPAGYTRAQVTGVSALAMSSAVVINMRTRIDGTDGTTMPVLSNSSGFGNGASTYAASLTGLTGGGTFTVTTRCQATSGGTLGYIITSATVIYLR